MVTKETQSSSAVETNPSSRAPRDGFWCRDCSQEAVGNCLDLGHSVCSLRKHRAGQLAPQLASQLDSLRDAARSARKVVDAVKAAADSVETVLKQWQGRMRQIEEAEEALWAAADEGRDAAELPVPTGLQQLARDAAGLLEYPCHLFLTDAAKQSWKAACLQPKAAGAGTLFPLLLQLHQDRALSKPFLPTEVLDAEAVSEQPPLNEEHEIEKILRSTSITKVKKLIIGAANIRPLWVEYMLERVAPRVEWLYVHSEANRQQLDKIRDMPSLRHLFLGVADGVVDAPELPLQLEELEVFNFYIPRYWQSVQKMPNLRKLTLIGGAPLDVALPALPQDHRGLQFLRAEVNPTSASLALVKAHAATLQDVRILCASEGDAWPCQDLAEVLGACGLRELRRVVLLRKSAIFDDVPHGPSSCTRQKRQIWDKLLQGQGADQAARVIQVLCELCDDCPIFPPNGALTCTNLALDSFKCGRFSL